MSPTIHDLAWVRLPAGRRQPVERRLGDGGAIRGAVAESPEAELDRGDQPARLELVAGDGAMLPVTTVCRTPAAASLASSASTPG